MLAELLKDRDYLPLLRLSDGSRVTAESWPLRRAELLDALCRYSYGYTPKKPLRVTGELVSETPYKCFAGKVHEEKLRLTFETEHGTFSFPLTLSVPKGVAKPPVLLHLAFRRDIQSGYIPVEEITDNGFALVTVCYFDLVNDYNFPDHADFSDGLAVHFGTKEPRRPDEWGKIGMWAYGASGILDWLFTRPDMDAAHTAVIGHSRLGKTALWAAAQDERFFCAISNDSGYGGAASSRHGSGERIADFLRVGSWAWFCESFKSFADSEDSKPYDQSFLLALIAPRLLCVGSAANDRGADPESEFLTSLWASQAWELLGEKGLVTPDRLPAAGDFLPEGNICYHLRPGEHFLSREDWNYYMRFLNRKLGRV